MAWSHRGAGAGVLVLLVVGSVASGACGGSDEGDAGTPAAAQVSGAPASSPAARRAAEQEVRIAYDRFVDAVVDGRYEQACRAFSASYVVKYPRAIRVAGTCVATMRREFSNVENQERSELADVTVRGSSTAVGISKTSPNSLGTPLAFVKERGAWKLDGPAKGQRASRSGAGASGGPPRPRLGADASFPGRLLIRGVDPDLPDADGPLYEVSAKGGVRRVQGRCRRVHASSAGSVLCLRVSANGFDYEFVTMDRDHRARARRVVAGFPSRARVSRDGRYGSFTTFAVAGAGYFADTSRFSTFARIVDMDSGELLLRLEDLDVRRDGRRVDLEEAELWGVSFAGDGRFYATLAPGEDVEHLLVEGRVGSRRATVAADHVECPSLSPDGSRIAYKRRIGSSNRWRLHVRELAGGRDVALAETRSIDDQPEWLGDDLVAYSNGEAVYAVAADGSGSPRVLVDHAASPAWLGR